jgi:hypothetical protein
MIEMPLARGDGSFPDVLKAVLSILLESGPAVYRPGTPGMRKKMPAFSEQYTGRTGWSSNEATLISTFSYVLL